jgi:hypothetical protein
MYEPNPDSQDFELGLASDLGCDCSEADDFEMGRLLSDKRRGLLKKRLFKATLGPLALAHKLTHSNKSPIRKAELKLQGVVEKILPFTKPFIKFHNLISDKVVYKAFEKVGIAKKGETELADSSQTASGKSLLSDAAAAYSSKGGGSGSVSFNGQNLTYGQISQYAANPKAAAAQLAASHGYGGSLTSMVSLPNLAALNTSLPFRQATLSQLVAKAKGGNSSALAVLGRLKR